MKRAAPETELPFFMRYEIYTFHYQLYVYLLKGIAAMDIQGRKIHFVQEFLRLNNEALIEKFENLLKTEKQKLYSKNVSPMTIHEFNEMIDRAEDDAANGRTKSIDELNNDIDEWS